MRSVFFYKATRRSLRKNRLWYLNVWFPVFVAVCLVAFQSSNRFSSANTGYWLRPRWEHWRGHLNEIRWSELHQTMRKTAHFFVYSAVGFTFLRAWLHMLWERSAESLVVWRVEASILAVFSTAIVASLDEAHQTFQPDRSVFTNSSDVLLDSLGATTICVIVWLICWYGRNKTPLYQPRK